MLWRGCLGRDGRSGYVRWFLRISARKRLHYRFMQSAPRFDRVCGGPCVIHGAPSTLPEDLPARSVMLQPVASAGKDALMRPAQLAGAIGFSSQAEETFGKSFTP